MRHILALFRTLDPASAYIGAYNWPLVAISTVVAILASFVALSTADRMAVTATPRGRLAWASAGAISMGGGIWSMHFIGMLAFSLPCGVRYDPVQTMLSLVPGILASGVALSVISRPKVSLARLTLGALFMGAGIGAMHYWGMAAMRPDALLRYDPVMVGVSVLVAVALAYASLSVRSHLRFARLEGAANTLVAAAIMGCAISGMHYTAMQASIFYPLAGHGQGFAGLPQTTLALTVFGFGVLIAVSTLAAAFAGEQREVAMRLKLELAQRKVLEQELIQAREQAEAATAAKSHFLATMSHEIRTPMNGVLGMAGLLAATPLNDQQDHLVTKLTRSGHALLGVINDILDFSRIEAGKLELSILDFDPREAIAEVADLFAERCAATGLDLITFVSETTPAHVRGDAVRLRQVLVNLVGNALKFTEHGQILVELSARDIGGEDVELAFTVTDSGIGIPADQLGRVFNSFEQVDRSMRRVRGGSGLGLAICRQLVAMMAGEIGVESEPGRGSRFHFTIRCRRAAGAQSSERKIDRLLRVLLVDANAVSSEVTVQYLTRWGIVANVCRTLIEAKRKMAESPFDAVLLDIKGPGGAAIDFCRGLRLNRDRASPAIVLLLGMDHFTADTDIASAGAFAVLNKPIRASELFECLTAVAVQPGGGRGPARFFVKRQASLPSARFAARLLVAEDNPVNQDVATGILENMGCEVVTAANGAIAIERFAAGGFDLVLMDCEMPEMDGLEAARRIRTLELDAAEPSKRRTPMIALTAHALATVREACLEAGMDDFLTKPLDENQLNNALRRWIPERELPAAGPSAAPPQPEPQAEPIDRVSLEKISLFRGPGRAERLARVVDKFQEAGSDLARAIVHAASGGDAEALWRAAHGLKSSAAALGATSLAARCARIESLARAGDLETTSPLVAGIEADLAAAVGALRDIVDEAAAGALGAEEADVRVA